LIGWTGEAEAGHPYWWDGAIWPDLSGALPDRADLLIIGAGYTGLSAAIAAHDAGAKVVVVDTGQPGQGASTRNGGMVGAHPRVSWDKLRASYGKDVADGVWAEAGPSLEFAKDLIARERINCDYEERGRLQLAWTKSHFETQKATAEAVREKSRVGCEVVEKPDLSAHIGTDHYHGGIFFPEHGALHPRKYHNGLLAAVLNRGVPVIGEAEVIGIEKRSGGNGVETAKGSLSADKILLATNGYTGHAFPWHARRVFALPSFLIATEPLSPNLIGELAPGRRMMVETRARHSYFRVSPDGTRILFGGRAAMVNVDLNTAAKRLYQTMTEIWPALEDTRLSHVWTGNTGYSFTHMPQVGATDGLYYAMGFSGSGTVLAPYLGAKAAWQALGDERGETAYSKTALRPSWLMPGTKPQFLNLADLWYRFRVDPKENWEARRP